MNENNLKVHEYVIDISLLNVGQVHYGAWKNENIGIDRTQYGKYVLFYNGQKYFRVGFDNLNWNYIIRTDRTFSTYPMS